MRGEGEPHGPAEILEGGGPWEVRAEAQRNGTKSNQESSRQKGLYSGARWVSWLQILKESAHAVTYWGWGNGGLSERVSNSPDCSSYF